LIDELGDQPDVVYCADSRWDDVVINAGISLFSMVLAGGYSDS
jgi:hypothetical protein